jgi:hypothetical protein
MKAYLILDDNKDVIIPLESIENTFSSKMAQIIKPLGDTRSILNISMEWNYYKYLRDEFSKSWKRSLAVAIIDNDKLTLVNYYGSFVSELTTTADSEIVDLELHSDYHEIHYDSNDELKSLFKSWEREVRLNQLGI